MRLESVFGSRVLGLVLFRSHPSVHQSVHLCVAHAFAGYLSLSEGARKRERERERESERERERER